ncbi:MAG TPA: hypothetical protein VJS44_16940 [Pyrinomonadaceae bacterium]|nr:hypothetical protein [Pyrinomonadaceae bacterium]
MKKISSAVICLTILLMSLCLAAVGTSSKGTAPKFTSLYTDLSKQCRDALPSVGEGQDMPLKCKGYGGYQISIGYSAASSHLAIVTASDEQVVSIGPQPLSYYDNKKVEWRMADGKPFAVIIRVSIYKDTGTMDMDTYSDKNKTGESLLVRGLKGYEYVDGAVDARQPDANVKARQLADSQYK